MDIIYFTCPQLFNYLAGEIFFPPRAIAQHGAPNGVFATASDHKSPQECRQLIKLAAGPHFTSPYGLVKFVAQSALRKNISPAK
ncbi:MAG: hypothetical protein LBQ83_01355 [Candidatus Margulisbacteria bacterium]|nr:hypothetical protein [Candidatus Margulisiibacteriota bacterium]